MCHIGTTVKLRQSVMKNTGMSQSKFYELIGELAEVPGVSYDEVKRLWSYQNSTQAKLT
jgi:hypothetical protein